MGYKTIRFRLLPLVLLSVLLPAIATAQDHVALVIGNADYEVKPLRNPLKDARD
jgi:hypothetical protein